MKQNEAKFTLNMVLIENQESKKFTAYFTQFPEIIVDGLTQSETETNLIKSLGYFLDYKTNQNLSSSAQNHVIRKTIDFNYEEA